LANSLLKDRIEEEYELSKERTKTYSIESGKIISEGSVEQRLALKLTIS